MNRIGRGCSWLFCATWICGWTILTLAFDGKHAHSMLKQQEALGYPSVEGTVTKSEVGVRGSGDEQVYYPKISYRYLIAGREYRADRYRYSSISVESDGAHAREIVAMHPRGSRATVYYNPADPAESLLAPGVSSGDFFIWLFLTPFNLVMVGAWCVVAAAWRARARIVPDYLRIADRGTELRARPPRVTPIVRAALAALAASFVLALAMGFTVGGAAPPTWAIASAWGAVLGAAGMAYASAASCKNDLVIDRVRNTLLLPRQSRGALRTPIRLAKIASVGVKEEAISDSDGNVRHEYACQVCWKSDDGQIAEAAWLPQADKQAAEELAAWLRKQCGIKR